MTRIRLAMGTTTLLGVIACSPGQEGVSRDTSVGLFEYGPVETRLLDNDLVNFHVEMRGATSNAHVEAFSECVAAQYTLIRGYGFARHVRTTVQEEAGLWRADAVYTVSPSLPQGRQTIDAEVVVADCDAQGIPTV